MAPIHPPPSWQTLTSSHRDRALAQIRKEWHLTPEILATVSPNSPISVTRIPAQSSILDSRELEITETLDATALLEKLSTSEYSAVEVCTAFCKRTAIAQQLTNCLTEIFFETALERAKVLDEYLKRKGRPMGPLHGLPISLKDSLNVTGEYSTIEYVSFIKNGPATENSPLVDILLSPGAVLYVKTNVPQSCMRLIDHSLDCRFSQQHFWTDLKSEKSHPYSRRKQWWRSALVALRGSLLGVGTDIAGSIRIPSICCGTYGFRPPASRIPMGDKLYPDLRLFLQSVIQASPWKTDLSCPPIPWSRPEELGSLRIGLLLEDPLRPCEPEVLHTIQSVAQKLISAGHEVIPLGKFPSIVDAEHLALSYFALDHEHYPLYHATKSGEPLIPSLVAAIEAGLGYEKATKTLEDPVKMNLEKDQLIEDWTDVFRRDSLDVVLAPGAPHPAVPHDTYLRTTYTIVWNLVDRPACIIPADQISSTDIKEMLDYLKPAQLEE
ncbi:amidase signature enzyme [Aspergillus brunneoviolaceus CBS 621.78]|uniref:Amidase signature enzyme n=1 Tax=Aspergillus brunneoviolaceus CBS 621.78 TaxID=1450534 RepID=A0ACD1FVM9_9EURO|nr:amidase signature enzyme [Aspergillus brunneoviolaceus CBS 621.78]RAH41009.1 amidase signature enzyme [Aspergillus brunneoviolaceus CBS 621.78]